MTKSILAVCMVFFLTVCCSAAEPEIKAEDLPRIKPTEPADALKTFKVRPGFHIELAASEPQVVDPIAMCFDENGRLFVVEMRDYSERRNEKLGRIRMLEDTDDDGVFDKATVFLDHLPWPTALFWCNGGLLVGATPDIIFAKDTDKDGVADQTQRLFTGFGATQERLNVQGLFNNFIWGLDNRVHGCSGHDGGLVERVAELGISRAPTRERAPGENAPLDVRNRGFVINPSDWSMKTENGGGQYGLSFDPTGRLFTCTNSSHCELFMFDARYASQNPSYAPPDPRISIAADGPAAEVFRISPEEPWRVIRTRWRIAGLVPGPVEGGGRSAGYFTGATGITIYRGNAFGPEYVGDAFIGDAGGNLVHHKRIRTPRGEVQPLAERPADEKKMEFCASNDTWFRAVDFANAPDGCLYIADMYRETIEHPWSIPPNIKKFLDLNSGNDRGRIYRLVPDGYVRPKKPRLGKASTEELVAMLEHPNGWHRETAARLLFERQDQSAVPLLTGSVQHSQSPLARMHALYALDGLSALTESHVVQALADPDSTVRVHAIKLAERFVQDRKISAQLSSHLLALADDPEIAVRYQLAFTLGQIDAADRIEALAKLAQTDGRQRWMQVAVLTAIGEGNAAAALFQRLCDEGAGEMLHSGALQRVIGARHDADEVKRVLSRVMVRGDEGFKLATARGLLEGAEQNNAAAGLRPLFGDVFKLAIQWMHAKNAEPAIQQDAAAVLAYADAEEAVPVLLEVMSGQSGLGQLAALAALDRFDEGRWAQGILARFGELSPRLKSEFVNMMMKRPERRVALLKAVKQGAIRQSDLTTSQVNTLVADADVQVRRAAGELLKPPAARATVIEKYRPAITMQGDASAGRAIFQQRCISCHQVGSEGSRVGPDLVTVKNSGREKLLTSILDPNREVAASYIAYSVDTKSGDNFLGILASDTTTSITIRQAYGKESTLQRSAIKRMVSQGKSLMPEGLETDLTPQHVADLLSFIESSAAPATQPK